ncbi:hypothetical protein Nepgr_030129 [Nepenthes gracilis]|uniref:Cystatin domain-containing protein n=1 Tax=Nepenthes gracilis TaxID=150966 RepID=A0AAD3TFM8_NEPGR|nr:hypothetical protein Nepgr_030129 [Nepenthes gracilis]
MHRAMALQISLILIISVMPAATRAAAERGIVGGRMKIRDVTANEEVQDLGRFSVEQFNKILQESRRSHLRNYHQGGGSGGPLEFEAVVEAEKQLVSGLKYYLKIDAKQGRFTKTFDAVVVVKAWLNSKELLSFAPSPARRAN